MNAPSGTHPFPKSKKAFFSGMFITATLLITTPWWVMALQEQLNLRWFTTSDSFWLLGLTLFAGLLSALLFPSGIIHPLERISKAFTKYYSFLLIVGLPLGIFVLYQINQHVLHSFLNSADEHSCYFLAECIRRGKLLVASHPLSEFFDVVHVGNRDGKWFSVYPLGWPLIWAVGLELQIVDWLNPVLSSLSLILFYKAVKRLFHQEAAFLGVLLTFISPFFLFTSASYFSHSTCLFLISVFLYAFLKWQDASSEKAKIVWAIICTTAIGYGFTTRYLTMAAVAFPFMIYHYWPYLTRKKKFGKAEIIGIVIITLFFLSIFVQNHLVTGKFYKAPNKYDKSWERLGFSDEYTPLMGLNYIIARFFYLADWCAPFFIVIYLISLFQKRSYSPYQQIFRFGIFTVVIAYFFYFSWGGNQYGPRYYYEGFPFLTFTTAEALIYWWRHRAGDDLKKFLLGSLLAALATSGYLYHKQASFFEESSRQRKALYLLAEETIESPAIVFIRGFLGHKLVMSQEDAVRNSPFLDELILYAHDRGDVNQKLMDYYPNREYYFGSYDRENHKPILNKGA